MDFQEYIKSELLVLVPILYIIGLGLKKSKMKDKWIPLVLGLISIVLSAVWVYATSQIESARDIAAAFFTSVTQGVLTAGASVYASQIYLQAKKDE